MYIKLGSLFVRIASACYMCFTEFAPRLRNVLI